MFLLPVIDLLDGVVVRGVAGDRDNYRPIQSRLTTSTEPLAVAQALLATTGGRDLYVADLDAILRRRPNRDLYRQLAAEEIRCWIDAGLTAAEDCDWLPCDPRIRWIAGLESLESPQALGELQQRLGSERLTFSLDLKRGVPLGGSQWPRDPLEIVDRVHAFGIRSVIVLDLGDVGTHTGGSTRGLCRTLQSRYPDFSLIAGGGVRQIDDLIAWHQQGIAGVLIASALHDLRISRADLQAMTLEANP